MKNSIYLMLFLLSGILFSCEKTVENPSESSKKLKYIVEGASWNTYLNPDYTSGDLNVVYKGVYERGEDVKYLKSESQYMDNELTYKCVRENIDDMDVIQQVYPTGYEEYRDTIIWYDDARTKYLELRGGTYKHCYQYDNSHRLISSKSYQWERLTNEYSYTYSGLTRYGESKSYDMFSNEELRSVSYDTIVYSDESFSQQLSWTSKTIYHGDIGPYSWSFASGNSEYIEEGISKEEGITKSFDAEGNMVYNDKYITEYAWKDALNVTYTQERYINDILYSKSEGYTKYVQ